MVREFTQIAEAIGIVERGDFQAAASEAMQALLVELGEIAGRKDKVSGSITIKLNFEVQAGHVGVRGEFATKAPPQPRRQSMFFLTANGGLSQEPQSGDLFANGPRDVSGDKRDAG